MKITVITSPFGALPPVAIGAVEKLFYSLAGAWIERGHEVCFICAGGGNNESINHIRLKRYVRSRSTKKDLIWDFIYSIKALWKCQRTDILLCNTFWSPFLAPLFRWKYKCLIYGVHRYPKGQFFLYPFVHMFICVSTVVAEALKNELRYKAPIVVVNNPIDVEVFKETLSESNEVNQAVVISYAGRIHPEKGIDTLIGACEVLSLMRPVTLRLIGAWDVDNGGGGREYVSSLNSQVKKVKVELEGPIYDPVEMARLLRKSSVFVYPSVAEKGETFGVAPLEAMGLGLPVVLSDLKCFGDYAQNNINCVQYEKGECAVEKCAAAIEKILDDVAFAASIKREAAITAKKFAVDLIADEYIVMFEKAIHNSI